MNYEEIKSELLRLEREADGFATLCYELADKTRCLSGKIGELRNSIDEPDPEPEFYSKAVFVGNPGLTQYPLHTEDHCFARGIRRMILYKGRVYLIYGDIYKNQGPVKIWSFGPKEVFAVEYEAKEEGLQTFRVMGSVLVVPGADRDGGTVGAIYTNTDGLWREYHNIEDAYHVWKVDWFGCHWYALVAGRKGTRIVQSLDLVDNWSDFAPPIDGLVYQNIFPLSDRLLVFAAEDGVSGLYWTKDGAALEKSEYPPFFGTYQNRNTPNRMVAYHGGVLYSSRVVNYALSPHSKRLYWCCASDGGNQIFDFVDEYIRDIKVADDTVYVLTSASKEPPFLTRLYKPAGVRAWDFQPCGEFELPALAASMEILNGKIYVGVTNRKRSTSSSTGYADVASGGIYTLGV